MTKSTTLSRTSIEAVSNRLLLMAAIMVDTDVYSYITASNPQRGLPYKQHLDGHTITLSFITVGEQYAGYIKKISQGAWPTVRLGKLEVGLKAVAIVPYDIEVCKTFGEIKAALEVSGKVSAQTIYGLPRVRNATP
jgi:predicted nucleic acid-binding protein